MVLFVALFLIDDGYELWLWQGWWPERDDDMDSSTDHSGSRLTRWHLERRAAMQTALNYWRTKGNEESDRIYLVWAGLEPSNFINLFHNWVNNDGVSELNIKVIVCCSPRKCIFQFHLMPTGNKTIHYCSDLQRESKLFITVKIK